MGIQGLLPLLKSIHEHKNISEFAGKTLAVDAYVWLHRGAYSCASQLVQGQPTTRYVDYAMYRVRLLKHHNITPYLVFDGGPLPAKKGTESSRKKSRDENRIKAQALEAQGHHSQARDFYTKALDVTPEMAYQLIKALKAEEVSYVVAPYEADPQLAFLERSGIVDGIITEDSDLLVFGCKQVLFKLDSDGNCVFIHREKFAKVTDIRLFGWGDQQFREMAMLSGCDYLPSITGLGVKTSHKLLRKHKTVEMVLRAIRVSSQLKIPSNYLKDFRTAELAFLYQRVYDPTLQRLVTLSPVPENIRGWDDKYVGEDLAPDVAKGLAEGSLHPFTLEPMQDINPSFQPHLKRGNSSKEFGLSGKGKILVNKNNLLTNYFISSSSTSKKASTSHPNPSVTIITEAKENLSFANNASSGSGSGKRTLTMEYDAAKQRQIEHVPPPPIMRSSARVGTSRFFAKQSQPQSADVKHPHLSSGAGSNVASYSRSPSPLRESAFTGDGVTQEDGYHSPAACLSDPIDVSSPPPSYASDDEDYLSSPSRSPVKGKGRYWSPPWDDEFVEAEVEAPMTFDWDADLDEEDDNVDTAVPLPITHLAEPDLLRPTTPVRDPNRKPTILVGDTPTKGCYEPEEPDSTQAQIWGPDLQDSFETLIHDGSSDIGDFETEDDNASTQEDVFNATQSMPNVTPVREVIDVDELDLASLLDDDEGRQEASVQKFAEKWAASHWKGSTNTNVSQTLPLPKRKHHDSQSPTTVTRIAKRPQSARAIRRHETSPTTMKRPTKGRTSLPSTNPKFGAGPSAPRDGFEDSPNGLDQFRYKPLRLR